VFAGVIEAGLARKKKNRRKLSVLNSTEQSIGDTPSARTVLGNGAVTVVFGVLMAQVVQEVHS
jgi:hypothetical protein